MGTNTTSGTTSFEVNVPYKLIETGGQGKKPLMVYLHGFNQNIETFQNQVSGLLSLKAYHLFIQGPYPIYDRSRKKKVEEWGRAWYLYDGGQDQFIKSMEKAASFIEGVIGDVQSQFEVARRALLGYSMGGYLAGYYALTRPEQVQDLIVMGGRLKTEITENNNKRYQHLKVLALHGSRDKSVDRATQKESCRQLSNRGASVTFKEIQAGHRLTEDFVTQASQWMMQNAYMKV